MGGSAFVLFEGGVAWDASRSNSFAAANVIGINSKGSEMSESMMRSLSQGATMKKIVPVKVTVPESSLSPRSSIALESVQPSS